MSAKEKIARSRQMEKVPSLSGLPQLDFLMELERQLESGKKTYKTSKSTVSLPPINTSTKCRDTLGSFAETPPSSNNSTGPNSPDCVELGAKAKNHNIFLPSNAKCKSGKLIHDKIL